MKLKEFIKYMSAFDGDMEIQRVEGLTVKGASVVIMCDEPTEGAVQWEWRPSPSPKNNKKLKEFTVPTNWWTGVIWGNGHTTETDPSLNGWRVRRYVGDALLAGRPAIKGCFTARPMSDGVHLDVGIYKDLTPEEFFDDKNYARSNCVYKQVERCSGWGLEILDILK